GQRVIFSRSETTTEGTREELLMVDANGGNLRYLTEHEPGEARDAEPTVSPGSTSTDLEVAFNRNAGSGTHLFVLKRTGGEGGPGTGNNEFRQLTFPQQSTPEGFLFSTSSRIHWGANQDHSVPDEAAPHVEISAPLDG